MTHDARLPTIEQIMNGNNPYELVDSPFAEGKMEAWRAQSIATGVGGALAAMHKLYEMVRNDTADASARADDAKAREALVAHLCDQVAVMQERINALADELETRQRADAEKERHQRRFDEEPVTLPPDIEAKQALSPPAKIESDDTHPSEEPEPTLAELEDPDLEVEDDQVAGDPMPKEIEDPPDPVPEPRGSVYPQPVSISLNKE
jgi:hypothetical protein